MIRRRFLAALGLSLGLAAPAISQSPSETKIPKHVAVAPASPREADVSTIDGIVKAYYDVISGPAGQPRQSSRDRSLYPPDVRFVEIHEGKDGKIRAQRSSLEDGSCDRGGLSSGTREKTHNL
jgi:hypothetical protein